jgi:predicted N-acetyltransferase YhbS
VPVYEDPAARPAGRLLIDDERRPLARFLEGVREGRRFADLFAPVGGVASEPVVDTLLRDLAGWRVACSPALARELIAVGGRAGRHAHVMRRSLSSAVPAAWGHDVFPGVDIVPVDCTPAALAPAMLAAHPPDHPDFEAGEDELVNVVARLKRMFEGREAGPVLGCSRVAIDGDGRVRGAAIVTEIPVREPPMGGPWLAELFREPGWGGLGAALLHAALWQAATDRHPAVGLAVTDANAARGLYEATGFELVSSWLSVDLPDRVRD